MSPHDLTDATKAPLTRNHAHIVRFFKIWPVDGETLWWTSDNVSRTFRGNVCTPVGKRVNLGKVSKKTSPEVDRLTVGIFDDDTGRLAQEFLDGGLDGISVEVYQSPVEALDSGDGVIIYRGTVYSGSYSNYALSLDLKGSVMNDFSVPRRKFTKGCAWIFKGTECGYSGGETTCNKTLARCKVLSNTSNFGGLDGPPSA